MKTTRTGVERIGDNSYYIHHGQAVVTFHRSTLLPDVDKGKLIMESVPGTDAKPVEIMSWGKNNDLPQVREDLVTANNIVPALVGTKCKILVGNGIMAYREHYETGQDGKIKAIQEEVQMPTQAKDWFDGEGWPDGLNFYQYLDDAAGEYVKHSLFIPEFVRTNGGDIQSVEVKECKLMRAGRKENGRIRKWYWSGHWAKRQRQGGIQEEKKIVRLDVYTGEENRQAKFVMPQGDYLFNDGYYPIPTWWGSRDWIEMANFIAPFHKANLQNGYNMRWHVQVPADYFLDYEQYNAAATEDERLALKNEAQKKEQAFMDDVNGFLAGIANAGRTIWTKFDWDQTTGKKYPGIEITALEYDMKDESLLKLFERSNTANISSQGIHPTLANIETQGKLSSGTEIRNAFLMWLIINTPSPRKKMMWAAKLKKKTAKWPAHIHYAIRDYELTALSSNSAGMKQTEQPLTP